ncbi:hypothetical protein MLD38_020980 [Melastoma candidum]|uniref:Uncharacterized protein n=1 Tax=Melastoma candidum TaxID=119954 RepID=A0ACB9QEJ9_9MYRT|nr:hypothetical protein MLD38_020980 [Melastoma candidum]
MVLRDWSKKTKVKAERVHYTIEFTVGAYFGIPGAITVANKHQNEFFLETMTVEGFPSGFVHFPCNSWVQASKDHRGKRICLANKVKILIKLNQIPNLNFSRTRIHVNLVRRMLVYGLSI